MGEAERAYVVVSADTHASLAALDEFVSFLDPGLSAEVVALGDMSSAAIFAGAQSVARFAEAQKPTGLERESIPKAFSWSLAHPVALAPSGRA